MAYRNIKSLIKDLGCQEELEIEDRKLHERKDLKADREIVKRMKELGIMSEKHFDEEVCFNCSLRFRDCSIKNKVKEEFEK